MIGLLGIINACWGGNVPNIKWFHGLFVFIAVGAWTLDPIMSIAWSVYFIIWRTPSLSKQGFQVFNPIKDIWWYGTKFFLKRGQWMLLPLSAAYVWFGYSWCLLMMLVPTITAVTYSSLGWFFPIRRDEDNIIIRIAEYLTGMAIGGLITVAWMVR